MTSRIPVFRPPTRSLRRGFQITVARLFLPVLLSLTVQAQAQEAQAQETNPRVERIEQGLSGMLRVQGGTQELFSIEERMAHFNVPGVSVAVLDSGRVAWAKGYGVKDVVTGEPVTTTTLFQAASISKPVAAMAALRLVEEGLLDLDVPVNQYFRSWRLPENEFTEGNEVTLRHLLTHTGGLTVHGFPGYAVDDRIATTVEVLDGSGPANTDPVRVDTIPGSLWRYSGGGYTIMQLLLEDVTGKPFSELLRELVLDPGNMMISSYSQPMPPGREDFASSGHLSDGARVEGMWHVYPEKAAAGLWTNPSELAHLAMDVQGAFHGEEGHILSPEMTRAQLTPGLGGYGLGFRVQGEGPSARFSHGGSNHGFKAQFMAFMEGGRGVFVMTNGDRGSALAQEIFLAVAEEYGWPEPRYQEITLADLPAADLQIIAGSYRLESEEMDIVITVEGDHLRADLGGIEVIHLHPTAESFFIDLADGTRFRFHRDEGGAAVAMEVLGAGLTAEKVG